MSQESDTPKPKRKPGNPNWIKGGGSPNPHGRTKSQLVASRNLALRFRELMDPDEFFLFQMAVLMGHDPVLKPDPDREGRYLVTWDERGGIKPSLDQKQRAIEYVTTRAHGQAPQSIALDASLRGEITAIAGQLDFAGVLSSAQMGMIRGILENAIKAPLAALPEPAASEALDVVSEALDADDTDESDDE